MHRLRENFCRGGSFFVLAAFVVLHITEGNAVGDKTKLVTGSLPTEQEEISAETKTAVPHLQVYRDPQTGRFGPPPPGVAPMGQTDIERGR